MGLRSTGSATAPLSRRELLDLYEQTVASEVAWIREQVLQHGRADVLAEQVLGYSFEPHHALMAKHQEDHEQDLCLVFRGAGKTTVRTVVRAILLLLRDPNIRILIGSKSGENAQDILSEIRHHFESNERFRQVFGDLTRKDWTEKGFSLATRTVWTKEPNIHVVGMGGNVTSKHYDVIIVDDLVDEENSRTAYMRRKVRTFYYKTLMPCLDPSDGREGRLWVHGTRYHSADLYGHLSKADMKDSTLVIPALYTDPDGALKSNWPKKFPVDLLLKRRENMGSIDFEMQYECSTLSMEGGGIFSYDDIDLFDPDTVSDALGRYLGFDLAISKGAKNDYFVALVGAYDEKTGHLWIVDGIRGRFSFDEQRQIAVGLFDEHEAVRGCMETVAYQEALFQEVLRERPELPLVQHKTRYDKVVRAKRLSPMVERGQLHVAKHLGWLVTEIVRFPDHDTDDGLDAFDFLVQACVRKQRSERTEPGLFRAGR